MKIVLSAVLALGVLGCSEEKIETMKDSVESVVQPAKELNQALKDSGKVLFQPCSSCHGVLAQKEALNKSKIIRGWSSRRIVRALKGYQDGSYGDSMKAVMKPQVSGLSDEEIVAVARYISTL